MIQNQYLLKYMSLEIVRQSVQTTQYIRFYYNYYHDSSVSDEKTI